MRYVILFLLLLTSAAADDLTLQIAPRWRGTAIALPSGELANDRGQHLRITRLSALISGVALLRPDGSFVRLTGQEGCIDGAEGRWSVELRNVPRGDYAGIEFRIGVAPELNHADPARWPAGHPLNPIVNRLHWGWQGGFVFLALEGRWRAADDAKAPTPTIITGSGEKIERGFSYHLATDAHLMTVRFLTAFKVEGDTTAEFALELARILGARELVAGAAGESTHSGAGDQLAAELATATERAFFWLEAKASNRERQRVESATAGDPVARGYAGATPFAFNVPAGFPQPALPPDNPLTVEGIDLGRKLFRDRRLSSNGRQSCANCHDPQQAFSDRVPLSRGTDGGLGTRNSMPLVNLAWHPAYAWDGSQPRIRDQSLAAMTNPIEMHADARVVAAMLGGDGRVREDFAAAFGTREVTVERIGLAIEQYLLAQVSTGSKFDRANRGEVTLTDEEKRGFELFATEYDPARGQRGADCFHCHGGVLFSDFAYKNNGLDLVARADHGREKVTLREIDAAKFKTPSLRNVAVTAPYMHDGRFRTLEQVVAHYDHGVKRNTTLDPNIAKHPEEGIQLSAEDQRAIVAFLKTLTDARFANAPARPGPPPRGGLSRRPPLPPPRPL